MQGGSPRHHPITSNTPIYPCPWQIARVLRPGGTCIMSFSNRCFPTKAIQLWLETGNEGHAFLVGSYFHYGSPDFEPPFAKDISPYPGRSDPMFIVQASKKKKNTGGEA